MGSSTIYRVPRANLRDIRPGLDSLDEFHEQLTQDSSSNFAPGHGEKNTCQRQCRTATLHPTRHAGQLPAVQSNRNLSQAAANLFTPVTHVVASGGST